MYKHGTEVPLEKPPSFRLAIHKTTQFTRVCFSNAGIIKLLCKAEKCKYLFSLILMKVTRVDFLNHENVYWVSVVF